MDPALRVPCALMQGALDGSSSLLTGRKFGSHRKDFTLLFRDWWSDYGQVRDILDYMQRQWVRHHSSIKSSRYQSSFEPVLQQASMLTRSCCGSSFMAILSSLYIPEGWYSTPPTSPCNASQHTKAASTFLLPLHSSSFCVSLFSSLWRSFLLATAFLYPVLFSILFSPIATLCCVRLR